MPGTNIYTDYYAFIVDIPPTFFNKDKDRVYSLDLDVGLLATPDNRSDGESGDKSEDKSEQEIESEEDMTDGNTST